MSWKISLIRHGEIHARWKNHCYGAADVGLSARGRTQSKRLATKLADEGIDAIWSSDLKRARYLAELLAENCGLTPSFTPDLQERNFGTWEKRPWEDIYAEVGNDMEGMVRDPENWRPPQGETTFELRDRVVNWLATVPKSGHLAIVCHGGPIACLRGVRTNLTLMDWAQLVPACGERVMLEVEPTS